MVDFRDLFRSGIWVNRNDVTAVNWTCGYCQMMVSSDKGWYSTPDGRPESRVAQSVIRICPSCNGPTAFEPGGRMMPRALAGRVAQNVPDELAQLFREAQQAAAAGAPTAAAMACRKMLMNLAVKEGAEENKNFLYYVSYLADNNFIPPNGRGWVDFIRTRGNVATHEIALTDQGDADSLIHFVALLLTFNYELPALVPQTPKATT